MFILMKFGCDTLQQYRLANETKLKFFFLFLALCDTLQQYRLANETLATDFELMIVLATLYNNIA